MNIYDFNDYKTYVRAWVETRPKQGRGEFRRMSAHLGVSSTMISQIFSGDKHLNHELASDLCEFLNLSDEEAEFFFLLLDHARAGHVRLRKRLQQRLRKLQEKGQRIAHRVVNDRELSDTQKATYYASWIYGGIRNLLACPGEWTDGAIASRLKIDESQVRAVIRFLLENGMVSLKDQQYELLSKSTLIGPESPLLVKHHHNWRLRALQKMDWPKEDNVFYTSPMSLAIEDVPKVRALLRDLATKVGRLVADSPSETVRCLNFDWFEI